jgi:hypothetical protein
VPTVTGLTAEHTLELLADKADLAEGKVLEAQLPDDIARKGELVINVKDFGAVGDGVTDDAPAIQAALDDADAGMTVYLPPGGVYATDSGLVIPPQVRLLGSHGGHLDDVFGSVIKPLATFSGEAVILMVDQDSGGYSLESTEQRIEKISIDGSSLPGSTIDGILAVGYVHGVYLTDVQIRHIPNRGVRADSNASGAPYSWRATRLHVSDSGGIGINASMTDTTWVDCEVIGGGSHGWFCGGAANSVFMGCRSEWSALDGFNLGSGTGTGSGSGGPLFIGCTTDRNGQNGVSIPIGANGNGPVTFSGCTFRRDGRNSNSSGYSGINVNGSTQPIILSGCQVYPGTADDGSGIASPQYGLSATEATVQVNGGVWHAISEGIHNGGSNIRLSRSPNVMERTGPTTAPVTVTRGVQTFGTNGESLDVPENLSGIAQPRNHGLIAWSFPPEHAVSGKAGIAGTLYMARVYVPRPVTVTKIAWGINIAGVSPVGGQNWLCLYNTAGTLLTSFGVDSRVTTTGAWVETVPGVVLTTPGPYWIGFLFNASTMPQIYRGGDLNAGLLNLNLTNSAFRFAISGTSLTTPPSSVTPGSNASAQFSYFGALG